MDIYSPLDTLCWVVEEFVKCCALALLDGVLVEQLVRRHRCVRRLDPALHQNVLRVQHLRHAQAVSEPLIHCGQRVLHACAWFQSLRLQLGPGKLEGLGEELEGAHVEQKLLESALKRSILPFPSARPCRLSQSTQWCCFGPRHRDDGVDQHGNEPKFGKYLVVLRRQKCLLWELWRWG